MTLDRSRLDAATNPPGAMTTPWQGGFSVPVQPPAPPAFGSATIVIAQQSGTTGVLVSYANGIFTRQFWSQDGTVPLFVEVLQPSVLRQIRDQVVEQLECPGSGLDDLPLRAFVEAVSVQLRCTPSDRFAEASFGPITQPAAEGVLGVLTFPNDVTGTVLGSFTGVSAETHLSAVPAGRPTPLRVGDLRSLVWTLEVALATQDIDPLWQQMLSYARQVLPASAT
jgi:hypothetical protein